MHTIHSQGKYYKLDVAVHFIPTVIDNNWWLVPWSKLVIVTSFGLAYDFSVGLPLARIQCANYIKNKTHTHTDRHQQHTQSEAWLENMSNWMRAAEGSITATLLDKQWTKPANKNQINRNIQCNERLAEFSMANGKEHYEPQRKWCVAIKFNGWLFSCIGKTEWAMKFCTSNL